MTADNFNAAAGERGSGKKRSCRLPRERQKMLVNLSYAEIGIICNALQEIAYTEHKALALALMSEVEQDINQIDKEFFSMWCDEFKLKDDYHRHFG